MHQLIQEALASSKAIRTDAGWVSPTYTSQEIRKIVGEILNRLKEYRHVGPIETSIQAFVADVLTLPPHQCHIHLHTPHDDTQGNSDDLIFEAYSTHTGEKTAIIKAYNHPLRFTQTLSAFAYLKERSLTLSHPAAVIGVGKRPYEEYLMPLIAFEVAKGRSLASYFIEHEKCSGQNFDFIKIEKGVSALGRALGELHNTPPSTHRISQEHAHNAITEIGQYGLAFDRFLAETSLEISRETVMESTMAAMENFQKYSPQLSAGISLGDVHLGNFFYESNDDLFTWIDFTTLHESLGSHGQPVGIAERDIGLILERLSELPLIVGMGIETALKLQRLFLEGYSQTSQKQTDESTIAFFRLMGNLKSLAEFSPNLLKPESPYTKNVHTMVAFKLAQFPAI